MSVRVFLPIIVVAALSACGGSDKPAGRHTEPANNLGTGTTTTSTSTPDATGLKLITGIYDSSRDSDEAYLHIDESGLVTAFDYMGDASGSGENCYEIATDSSQINAVLSGGSVTFSESDQKYTLTNGATTLEFSYTSGVGISDFLYNNFVSAKTGLDLAANNINIKIGGDSALQTDSVQLTDILSSICS